MSGAVAAFFVLYAVVRVSQERNPLLVTLVIDGVQAVTAVVSGAVAFEVARRRGPVLAAAAVPVVVGAAAALLALAGPRVAVSPLVSVVWIVSAGLVYAGGRLWERHIRRRVEVQ